MPHDLFVRLLSYFRTVDLILCRQCCRSWRSDVAEALDAVTFLDITANSDAMNLTMINGCPKLSKVKVRGRFSSFLHLQTVQCVGHLTSVKLVTCSELGDEHVTGMLCFLPALQTLEIDTCEYVTDHALTDLYEQRMRWDMGEISGSGCLSTELRTLSISNCPNVTGSTIKHAILALAGFKLDTLKFSHNGKISTGPVEMAVRSLKVVMLRGCLSLTGLTLTAADAVEQLSIHDAAQLTSFLIQAPLLLSVAVTKCQSLQSVRLDTPQLRTVSLSGCRLVDTLLISNSTVESINLYQCMSLGEPPVQALLSASSTTLREVILDGMQRVSRLTISSPVLATLRMRGCKGLGSLTLRDARALRDLDVQGCTALSAISVDSECPVASVKKLGKATWQRAS